MGHGLNDWLTVSRTIEIMKCEQYQSSSTVSSEIYFKIHQNVNFFETVLHNTSTMSFDNTNMNAKSRLISSWLAYCNSLQAGISKKQIRFPRTARNRYSTIRPHHARSPSTTRRRVQFKQATSSSFAPGIPDWRLSIVIANVRTYPLRSGDIQKCTHRSTNSHMFRDPRIWSSLPAELSITSHFILSV